MSELMDVVNERDEVVGQATQDDIYSKKLTHRIVHVLVLNPKTNAIYLQKRSETKSYLPGYYCTSAGGHVQTGETYEQAAKRELKEELGLDVPLKRIGKFNFFLNDQDRFIELFVAYAEDGINFADGEVASGEFLSMKDARELINKNIKIHPQLTLCFNYLERR